MLTSLQSLAIALMLLSGPSCQDSPEGPPQPPIPLTEAEKRAILTYLVHYESLVAENRVFRDYVARERALAEKEQANSDKAIDLARQEADLVRKELELERQRSEFYKAAYETLKGGRSKKCWFLKVVSFWLIPCK